MVLRSAKALRAASPASSLHWANPQVHPPKDESKRFPGHWADMQRCLGFIGYEKNQCFRHLVQERWSLS